MNLVKSSIIFLNGASSSGKTTIARLLQQQLDRLYLHVSFDHFAAMLPERFTLSGDENWERVAQEWGDILQVLLPGFNHAVAALAASGNNLIVDHVLLGEHNAQQCAAALDDQSVFFIGIDCPLKELERREVLRGDRPPGLVAYHFEHVHVPGDYDLRINTSTHSPEECAGAILCTLAGGVSHNAFKRLQLAHTSLVQRGF